MSIKLPQRQLVSQDDAAITQRADVPRSKFVGSWNRLTTFNAGTLVPILIDEILPGDHMNYDVTAYVRMSTPLFPIFSNQRVDTHFFFVPNRLVWDNWVRFMGEQPTPSSSIAFTVPKIELVHGDLDPNDWHTIWDFFGIPIGQIDPAGTIHVNALPFRAYNLIYNQWFRDQNLQTPATEEKGDTDTKANYFLQFRNKFHDYFTSALPWPQKFTAPSIPLAGNANVATLALNANDITVYRPGVSDWTVMTASTPNVQASNTTGAEGLKLYADLSSVLGIPINLFRQAFLVQQLLERDARGGTRYTELIRSHFGVVNPDFRLQRPEYIGGGTSSLNVTPVAQTAPATGTTVGALGAAATSVGQHRASYAATEHGFIIGLISVRTELAYGQGVHRMYSRTTRYDYYWPSLAGLGEQAILRNEIFMKGTVADTEVFGYQERWHEYRQRQSEVTGAFRTTVTGTIDPWHLAQHFTIAPTLGTQFIQDRASVFNGPMSRVLAAGNDADGLQYLADILFKRTAVRPLPTFGTPVTLGRF